jgi:hypothetical protein
MGAAMVTRAFISVRTTAVSMAAADECKCSDWAEATGGASNQQLKWEGEEWPTTCLTRIVPRALRACTRGGTFESTALQHAQAARMAN